jgi:hypothetical protein
VARQALGRAEHRARQHRRPERERRSRRQPAYRIGVETSYTGSRQRTTDDPESETTRRRYYGSAKYDRFLGERFYWYATSSAELDGVADLNLRTISGAGIGYRF